MSIDPTSDPRPPVSRREFVGLAVAAGGGLALAVRLPALAADAAAPASARAVPAVAAVMAPAPAVRNPAAFLEISADDSILFTTPSVELGQGAHTAMPMIVLEELGGDWQRLRVRDAAADKAYDNPLSRTQMTVGSFSVRGWYSQLRQIGAAAREMLVLTAAQQWSVPASECSVANSVITHGPSGRRCSFGSVAARAASLPVPQQPVLKDPKTFALIGTSPPRTEIGGKVDGSARFGIDATLPGLLHAAVKTCPTLGGTLKSFDATAARRIAGFHSVVALPDGVIVLASSWWQARKALDAVTVEYDLGALAGVDSAKISGMLHAALDQPMPVVLEHGAALAALQGATRKLEATYEVPYLAHACMEPMNCTARVDANGSSEMWCSTQAPQRAQQVAAKIIGVPPERVIVHSTLAGGGFGRRGEADFVAQAVTAAKAAGRPVKLIWTREEDIQHDYYRPAATIRFRAGLDAGGRLRALASDMVTASAPDFIAGGIQGPPLYAQGVTDMNYAIPDFRVTAVNRNVGIRWGFWRSVAHSHNPFMFESFIDEIAHEAQQDPYEFRRSLLQHPEAARQLRVLETLADKSGWHEKRAGRHLGIAAFQAYGSYIGTVVELSAKGKALKIHRVVSVVDCGVAIHPDNIRAQLQGGMVFGLTAALRGEITVDNGAVVQRNFNDYPLLKIDEMPPVECHIVPSSAAPGGIGEPGTAPIAPALANAIFAATGERVRSLPLSRLGYSLA
jgi:isoquinoline 1-oxidoreductase beta subunit